MRLTRPVACLVLLVLSLAYGQLPEKTQPDASSQPGFDAKEVVEQVRHTGREAPGAESMAFDDGEFLLDTGPVYRAAPGAFKACDLDSMLIFPSGTFYVAVVPVSATGRPATTSDSSAGGHSYYGTPGGWAPSPMVSGSSRLWCRATSG